MGLYQKQEFGIACDGDSGKCCAVFDVDSNARETVRCARAHGWTQEVDGWCCPKCTARARGACEEGR